jgi:hypothetical protein
MGIVNIQKSVSRKIMREPSRSSRIGPTILHLRHEMRSIATSAPPRCTVPAIPVSKISPFRDLFPYPARSMADIVYFDLETQRTANDVGGWNRKHEMRMSIGVTYSTATEQYHIYGEKEVNELIEQLRRADLVIGYNTINFDYHVLMGYTILDLEHELRSLDLMVEVEKVLGHRLKLEALASATLGVGKTAEGLDAIRWFQQGKMLEIAEYCCFDVKVTKLIHEHGVRNRELAYIDRFGNRQTVKINWQ